MGAAMHITDEEGNAFLYEGPIQILTLEGEEVDEPRFGQVFFRPRARRSVVALVEHDHWFPETLTFRLPDGADLEPPREAASPLKGPHIAIEPFGEITAGDASEAVELVAEVAAAVDDWIPRGSSGTNQTRSLGWTILFDWIDTASRGSSLVLRCTPPAGADTQREVPQLASRLFGVMSFAVGREIGIAPWAGFDANGRTVWVSWATPRSSDHAASRTWCHPDKVLEAIAALLELFDAVGEVDLRSIIERAMAMGVTANTDGLVLDVRIPVLCSALELMAWTSIRRSSGVDADALGKLPKSALLRLALAAARIPTDLAASEPALIAKRRHLTRPEWGRPELIYAVRNALVHPPKRGAEWPTADEQIEAWTLAAEFSDLLALHLVGFEGRYRRRSGIHAGFQEFVPWVHMRSETDTR